MKIFVYLILISVLFLNSEENIIVDSNMTLEEALQGTNAPQNIIDDLVLINVQYYGFDGKLHQGQLVMHKTLEKDIVEIFEMIKEKKFPIKKCVPIVKYNWSDNASMEDNNTSGFNYRFIAGTKRLSNHSYGRAIDINPFQNPAVYGDGSISPKGAKYDKDALGTLTNNHFIVKEFKKRGWNWGGDWKSLKDYQHFDKRF